MRIQYEVLGMTCGGCRSALVNALASAGIAVNPDDVSVARGSIEVEADVQPSKLKAAIEAAGFSMGQRLVNDVPVT